MLQCMCFISLACYQKNVLLYIFVFGIWSHKPRITGYIFAVLTFNTIVYTHVMLSF